MVFAIKNILVDKNISNLRGFVTHITAFLLIFTYNNINFSAIFYLVLGQKVEKKHSK
jgi:hypothetical protein